MQAFNSKKFWVAVIGMIGPVVANSVGQPPMVVVGIIVGAASYVLGQGLSDHGKESMKLMIAAAEKGIQIGKGTATS